MWINRYELEQKKHVKTHTDLMSKEAVFQEMSMNYKNLQTIVNNLEKNKEDQAVKMARILRQQTECLSENERFKRELLTQEKLL